MITIKRPNDKVPHTYTYLSTTVDENGIVRIRLLDEKEERITTIIIDESDATAIEAALAK